MLDPQNVSLLFILRMSVRSRGQPNIFPSRIFTVAFLFTFRNEEGGLPDNRFNVKFRYCVGHGNVSIRVPDSLFDDKSNKVKLSYFCNEIGTVPNANDNEYEVYMV